MSSHAWKATENASPDALVCTLAFVIDLLERSTERIAPDVLLDMIADKVTEYEVMHRELLARYGQTNGAGVPTPAPQPTGGAQ